MRSRCAPALLVLLAVPGCSLLITPGDNAARDPDLPDGGGDSTDGATGACPREVRIANNDDDGEIYNGVLSRSGSTGDNIYMGAWNGALSWTYFRFQIPPDLGPPGAVTLMLWGEEESGWGDNDYLSVLVEDDVDAPIVDSAGDLPGTMGGRVTLPQEVRWPAMGRLSWGTRELNESPDLSFALAALQMKGGMQPGQHVQLWIRPEMEFPDSNRDIATADVVGGTGNEARLIFGCP